MAKVKKQKDLEYYEAVGRRKEASARARLYLVNKDKSVTVSQGNGKQAGLKIKAGEIFINKKPMNEAFTASYDIARLTYPLKLVNMQDRFAISVLVNGGGHNSQLEAIVHSLARALNEVDKDAYRPVLKKQALLTRDSRTRERRKVGTGGKARRAKQSPKR